jgi:hypothetical protein
MKSFRTKLAAALALSLFSAASQAVLLGTNGDLESGAIDGSWVAFPNAGTVSIITPGSDAGGPASGFAIEASANNTPTGATMKYANVGAGFLTPGQAFTVDFDWKGTNGIGGVIDIRVFSELSGGGVSKTDILAGGTGAGLTANWTNFGATDLIAGTDVSGGVTVEFTAICGADAGCFSNLAIDNVTVSAVPIPAAVWLFGSGLVGLVGVARRRKKAA